MFGISSRPESLSSIRFDRLISDARDHRVIASDLAELHSRRYAGAQQQRLTGLEPAS
jgi:hypothetical protein